MNVLVTGGTGFVGNVLVNRLCARNARVTVVTRDPSRARHARVGVTFEPWLPDVSRFDSIVHLQGESIAGRRWNDAVKRELWSSRVDATRKLVDAIAAAPKKPRVLISASASGFYGDRGDELLTETSTSSDSYLGRMCVEWEREAARAESFGVRVVHVRIGIVLGPLGGALQKLVPLYKWGLGGSLGWKRAWFPWIHVDDLSALIVFALEREDVRGPLNAAAPGIVTNREFARELGRALSRPALLPVPYLALRVVAGEVAGALVASQRVVPERTLKAGFTFQFPELEPALRGLLGKG